MDMSRKTKQINGPLYTVEKFGKCIKINTQNIHLFTKGDLSFAEMERGDLLARVPRLKKCIQRAYRPLAQSVAL